MSAFSKALAKSKLNQQRKRRTEAPSVTVGVSDNELNRLANILQENIIGKRLGYKFTPCPTTRCLEDEFYPSPKSIAFEAYKMVTNKIDWVPREIESSEIKEFKGPF